MAASAVAVGWNSACIRAVLRKTKQASREQQVRTQVKKKFCLKDSLLDRRRSTHRISSSRLEPQGKGANGKTARASLNPVFPPQPLGQTTTNPTCLQPAALAFPLCRHTDKVCDGKRLGRRLSRVAGRVGVLVVLNNETLQVSIQIVCWYTRVRAKQCAR